MKIFRNGLMINERNPNLKNRRIEAEEKEEEK